MKDNRAILPSEKTYVGIPFFEQLKGAETILRSIIMRSIHAEEQYRDKLKLQKKGLMHDLLTGKVRVNANTPTERVPL